MDDDLATLTLLTILLEGDGYRILTASSAAEGFEVLALHEVHVIVCDQQMPGMNGTDFLNRVKELHPGALRIMLSGAADQASVVGTINRGEVYRYYTKPWDAEHLRHSLRDAFRHYRQLREVPQHDCADAEVTRRVDQPA